MIDLLVAGGGPVGLFAAIEAAQAGLDVVVIEPHKGAIDKACGEGLMPEALKQLARIGIDPHGINFFGIRYIAGDRIAEARFSNGHGRGVRRTTLQEALRERATDLNIKFVNGRVEKIAQSPLFIEAAGIQSRYLIGADGLHSTIREQLGLAGARSKRNSRHQRFGIRQHFSISPWSDFVEVYWLSDVEVYVTPVDHQTVGVAVLGEAVIEFDKILARIPTLVAHLQSAQPASKVRGAGPLRQPVRARSKGRALLVGDAAGYVDALTGEGLRIGFAEAAAAVRAVRLNDLTSYEADWQSITRSYRWLAGGLLSASANRVIRPMIVPAARALPSVFRRLINSI